MRRSEDDRVDAEIGLELGSRYDGRRCRGVARQTAGIVRAIAAVDRSVLVRVHADAGVHTTVGQHARVVRIGAAFHLGEHLQPELRNGREGFSEQQLEQRAGQREADLETLSLALFADELRVAAFLHQRYADRIEVGGDEGRIEIAIDAVAHHATRDHVANAVGRVVHAAQHLDERGSRPVVDRQLDKVLTRFDLCVASGTQHGFGDQVDTRFIGVPVEILVRAQRETVVARRATRVRVGVQIGIPVVTGLRQQRRRQRGLGRRAVERRRRGVVGRPELRHVEPREVEQHGVAEVEQHRIAEVEQHGVAEVEQLGFTEVEQHGVAEIQQHRVTEIEQYGVAEVEQHGVAEIEQIQDPEIEQLRVPGFDVEPVGGPRDLRRGSRFEIGDRERRVLAGQESLQQRQFVTAPVLHQVGAVEQRLFGKGIVGVVGVAVAVVVNPVTVLQAQRVSELVAQNVIAQRVFSVLDDHHATGRRLRGDVKALGAPADTLQGEPVPVAVDEGADGDGGQTGDVGLQLFPGGAAGRVDVMELVEVEPVRIDENLSLAADLGARVGDDDPVAGVDARGGEQDRARARFENLVRDILQPVVKGVVGGLLVGRQVGARQNAPAHRDAQAGQ